MKLYDPLLSHDENAYAVNQDRSWFLKVYHAFLDVMTVWMFQSGLKLWVRLWLCILFMGGMLPFAFLPHPFAIANAVAMVVILILNGAELFRVRGVNKNMGWQHVVSWTPVMIVNILSLTGDSIGNDGQLTWDNAGDDTYERARFVAVILNTVILGISILFDAWDTVLYYHFGKTQIERSQWTTNQLEKKEESAPTVDKV